MLGVGTAVNFDKQSLFIIVIVLIFWYLKAIRCPLLYTHSQLNGKNEGKFMRNIFRALFFKKKKRKITLTKNLRFHLKSRFCHNFSMKPNFYELSFGCYGNLRFLCARKFVGSRMDGLMKPLPHCGSASCTPQIFGWICNTSRRKCNSERSNIFLNKTPHCRR